MEARERNMILAATGNRYQLDLVEQAMKIQFLHDEKRDHDDRTGKYHNHILGGDVNEDDDHLTKNGEEQENSEEDLDALATAQEEEKQTLWHPWPQQTEHSRVLARNTIRYGCHVVSALRNRDNAIVPKRRRNENASSAAVTLGFTVSRKARETTREQGRGDSPHGVQRICHGCAHRNEHIRKKSPGATRSVGLGDPDWLARITEQRNDTTRFSLDRIKKTWHTFANGKRQQSEGEVALKANASGRTGDCKINCLNTSRVSILLSAPEFVTDGSRH